jgi:hypothetical protein
MFIDLSFRDFVGVVLVLFWLETTRQRPSFPDAQLRIYGHCESDEPGISIFRVWAEPVIEPRFAWTRWSAPE